MRGAVDAGHDRTVVPGRARLSHDSTVRKFPGIGARSAVPSGAPESPRRLAARIGRRLADPPAAAVVTAPGHRPGRERLEALPGRRFGGYMGVRSAGSAVAAPVPGRRFVPDAHSADEVGRLP
ncbi:hypothetical protein Ate01nite_29020 [Actinoplanes teichomyceticus]|nr:hypothetical protein Ate01nite_29020 [Actinoplanes teichomyceticus]